MCGDVVNPKVFVIHASEDKDRFVLDFGRKLRLKGIEAWVDKWEMQPGDSLVDKIFEEGIANAQAVIVVLSKYSVGKPWVREELNTSVVKRINEGIKLIPVIIDDCQVPECLKSTVWVKIKDLGNYDPELDRIVASIYGQYDRPPIGGPPSYIRTIVDTISDLTKLDSLVLKLSCEKAIEIGHHTSVDLNAILSKAMPLAITEEELSEAFEVLHNKAYIEASYTLRRRLVAFKITVYGFEEYAKVYIQTGLWTNIGSSLDK